LLIGDQGGQQHDLRTLQRQVPCSRFGLRRDRAANTAPCGAPRHPSAVRAKPPPGPRSPASSFPFQALSVRCRTSRWTPLSINTASSVNELLTRGWRLLCRQGFRFRRCLWLCPGCGCGGGRVEVVQWPAAGAEGGEGIGESLFPVVVSGSGACGVLDGGGGAGAVGGLAGLLGGGLAGVIPALHGAELAGAGVTGDGLPVGGFPVGAARVPPGVVVFAVVGLEAVEHERPPVARRQVLVLGPAAQPLLVVESG